MKKPRILIFVILTTITVIVWVIFDVYRKFQSASPVQVDPKILTPLTPTLNKDALQYLQSTRYFSESAQLTSSPTAP